MERGNVRKAISSTTGRLQRVIVQRESRRAGRSLPLFRASIPLGVLQTLSTHTSVKLHSEIINRQVPSEGTERYHSRPGVSKLSKGKHAERLVPRRIPSSGTARSVLNVKQKAADELKWEDIGQEAPKPRNKQREAASRTACRPP
jgi:hypothetical protein